MMEGTERDQAAVVPLDEIVRVCRVFADLEWPLPESAVAPLVERLGWTLISEESRFVQADTGWKVSQPTVNLISEHGELTEVSFRVTDVILEDVDWRADFLNDAFVTAHRAVAEALGPASKLDKGARSRASWDLNNGGRVSLTVLPKSVSANVSSAEWAEVSRRMGE